MKLLIIGCGNIGQRHLESLLKIYKSEIYVLEENKKTLKKIREKFRNKNLKHFFSNFKLLSSQITYDTIIISTNSDKRLQILKKIIFNIKFKFLILEKIAFINNEQFLYALKHFKKYKRKIFVNFPLRSVSFFKKEKFKNIKNFEMNIYGSNWNLFSNAIHYLDLFFYITNKAPKFYKEKLIKRVFKSKRFGFHEGFGKLIFKTNCEKKLTLNSFKDSKLKYSLFIEFKINNKSLKYFTVNGYEFFNHKTKKIAFKVPF